MLGRLPRLYKRDMVLTVAILRHASDDHVWSGKTSRSQRHPIFKTAEALDSTRTGKHSKTLDVISYDNTSRTIEEGICKGMAQSSRMY